MKIVKASIQLEYPQTRAQARAMLRRIEGAGRTCYKSEGKRTKDSAGKFCSMILGRGHESVLEHSLLSVRYVTDRGVSHEIVRHRLAAYSQESTRFVNYQKKGGVQFIDPRPAFPKMPPEAFGIWKKAMERAEADYLAMEALGCPPELCRAVLPNSTRTELVQSMNLREARHFIRMRCAGPAHPQMREVALPLLGRLNDLFPEVFGDQWRTYHPRGKEQARAEGHFEVGTPVVWEVVEGQGQKFPALGTLHGIGLQGEVLVLRRATVRHGRAVHHRKKYLNTVKLEALRAPTAEELEILGSRP